MIMEKIYEYAGKMYVLHIFQFLIISHILYSVKHICYIEISKGKFSGTELEQKLNRATGNERYMHGNADLYDIADASYH